MMVRNMLSLRRIKGIHVSKGLKNSCYVEADESIIVEKKGINMNKY